MSLQATLAVPDAVGLSAALDMSGFDVDSPFALQLLSAGASDAVAVWMTDDSAATSLSVSNAVALASITGAGVRRVTSNTGTSNVGAPNPRYLYVQRTAASTAGVTLSITGRETPGTTSGGSATAIIPTLAVGDTAVAGNIGALTAAQSVNVYSAFTLTQTTGGALALTLATPSTTTATRVVEVHYLAASTQSCTFYGVAFIAGIASSVVMLWNGLAWVRSQPAVTLGGNNVGIPVIIGTTDAFNVSFIANSSVFGRLTQASGNLDLNSLGTGTVVLDSNSTGDVSLGTGALGVDANAKTIYIAGGAAAKTIHFATGASGVKTVHIADGASANVVTIANGAAANTVTMGSQTTSSVTTVQGGTSPTGADAVLVTAGAAGGIITVNPSTTGSLNLGTDTAGTDANAKTIAIGTGTGGNTISIGGAGAGANTINIGRGTSSQTIRIGDGAAANAVTLGSTNTTSTTAIQGGSGAANAVTITATGTGGVVITGGTSASSAFNVGAGGTLTLGGAAVACTINVGGAGVAGVKTINVGATAAANVVTVGSSTASASTTLQAGTGAAGGIVIAGGLKSSYTVANLITLGAGAVIGTAAATVDAFNIMELSATMAAQTYTLPSPADTTRAHDFTLINAGANSFTLLGKTVTVAGTPQTASVRAVWSPTAGAWLASA